MGPKMTEFFAAVSHLPPPEQESLAKWLLDYLQATVSFAIEQTFEAPFGRGPIVIGKVEAGVIELGDLLVLDAPAGAVVVRVGVIGALKNALEGAAHLAAPPAASAGDSVGLELLGIATSAAKGSRRLRGFGGRGEAAAPEGRTRDGVDGNEKSDCA
jgi:hypothetical protein